MKYVTKENFQQYDTALKDYIDDTFTQDLSSYGVSWKPNVADPHLTRVGNMTYHKSLPIQNNMKGCIAQMKDGAKIIYYLNPTDWRFRESPTILYNKEVSTTIIDDVFGDLKYDQQYVKINNIVCQVISINTSTKTATIKPESTLEAGTYDIELGSCTNGYDGEVMVEVPEFWIKSWDTDTRREVRITPTYIDDSWEHQPHILVSPYHDTVLNAIPTNMGYLSTLEIDSAVSICNINDYCRGGNNDASYDQYITTDRFRTDLGKPRTLINRATMRTNCRKSGKEILSYLQYKSIMYWLYVIEYANFNCQEEFKEELTSEGFRQGGLGMGVTNISVGLYWKIFNNTPIIPCGYANLLGNNTNIKILANYTVNLNTWASNTNYYGISSDITATKHDYTFTITNIKNIHAVMTTEWFWASGIHKYKIEGLQKSQSITFKSGRYTQTVDNNGEFDINWDVNIKQSRRIIFNFTGDCNIELTITQTNTVNTNYTFDNINIPKWHGIENPFGDIYTIVDGIIINSSSIVENDIKYSEVYATDDPLFYNDSDYSKMRVIGIELNKQGYTKEWDLGNTAEIVPRLNGGNATQYKCVSHYTDESKGYRALIFGGNATTYNGCGLGRFSSNNGLRVAYNYIGFRSSCIIK